MQSCANSRQPIGTNMDKTFLILEEKIGFYLGYYLATYKLSNKITSANKERKILNEQILILNDKNLKLKM